MLSLSKKYTSSLVFSRNTKIIQNRQFVEYLTPAVCISIAYCVMNYRVSKPEEKILITGPFTKNEIDIKKNVLILPFQKYKYISTQSHSINTLVNAMTKEKIPFDMPMYFTVCLDDSSQESITLYAKKFGNMEPEEINNIIESIVHGEVRILTGGMEVEDVFGKREIFKEEMEEKIQKCMAPFGIKVDNVNIGELNDSKGSDYFKNLRERSLQKAQRDASVATAEHNFKGDIDKKTFEVESRQKVSSSEVIAFQTENENKQTMIKSKTQLEILQANQDKESKLAQLEATAIAKKRDIELLKEIAEKEGEQNIAQQKAELLSKSIVERDALVIQTEAKAKEIQMLADAEFYSRQKSADAELYFKQKEAEGKFALLQKEAEGKLALLTAEAEGLKRKIDASGGDLTELKSYMMVDTRQHVDIAGKMSESLQNMHPTIISNGSSNTVSNTVTDIGISALTMAKVFKDQLGIDMRKIVAADTVEKK